MNDDMITQVFKLAERIDLSCPELGDTTAKEIVGDWIFNGELPLAIEMLSDALVENDVCITPEDYNDFVSISERVNNSERVVSRHLEALVRPQLSTR